jgi:hypothetical protein
MTACVVGSRNRSPVGIHPAAGLAVSACPRRRLTGRGPAARGTRVCELRKIRHRGGGLVYVPCAKHHAHPAVQLVELELSQRVVLAEQGDQPLTVGVAGLRLADLAVRASVRSSREGSRSVRK